MANNDFPTVMLTSLKDLYHLVDTCFCEEIAQTLTSFMANKVHDKTLLTSADMNLTLMIRMQ